MDLTGIEVVTAGKGNLAAEVLLIVGTRLLHVSKNKVGFAHYAGHMRLAVLGDLVKEVLPEVHHIFVVLEVEPAFKHIVVCKGLEAVVL